MSTETPASILARADRAEWSARAAEGLRATIRLRGKVWWRVRRSLSLWGYNVSLGRGIRKNFTDSDIDALYDALAIVRDRRTKEAHDLRARVEVTS